MSHENQTIGRVAYFMSGALLAAILALMVWQPWSAPTPSPTTPIPGSQVSTGATWVKEGAGSYLVTNFATSPSSNLIWTSELVKPNGVQDQNYAVELKSGKIRVNTVVAAPDLPDSAQCETAPGLSISSANKMMSPPSRRYRVAHGSRRISSIGSSFLVATITDAQGNVSGINVEVEHGMVLIWDAGAEEKFECLSAPNKKDFLD